eukprot:TRINITY_DN67010_c2_g1_i1.p1 TRINITY_DN67010_c2_g1~~TRINITY_DN67010_c2_g1_i1.p1  ORF type:complete len:378 (-),score=41.38 TRINITY_DN67010_c2_g1_i1:62-1195(-)
MTLSLEDAQLRFQSLWFEIAQEDKEAFATFVVSTVTDDTLLSTGNDNSTTTGGHEEEESELVAAGSVSTTTFETAGDVGLQQPVSPAEAILGKKRKEGDTNFYLSLDNVCPVADCLNPLLGLFAVPTVAYYGQGYPQALLRVLVKCNGLTVPELVSVVGLPDGIKSLFQDGFQMTATSKVRPAIVDFAFTISSIAGARKKHSTTPPNMVMHGWRFPDLLGSKEKRPTAHVYSGIWKTASDCGVFQTPDSIGGLKFNHLTKQQIFVHGDMSRGMACSPNNHKFGVQWDHEMAHMWSVCYDPTLATPSTGASPSSSGVKASGCAVVCLHWLHLKLAGWLKDSVHRCFTFPDLLKLLVENKKSIPPAALSELLEVFGRKA